MPVVERVVGVRQVRLRRRFCHHEQWHPVHVGAARLVVGAHEHRRVGYDVAVEHLMQHLHRLPVAQLVAAKILNDVQGVVADTCVKTQAYFVVELGQVGDRAVHGWQIGVFVSVVLVMPVLLVLLVVVCALVGLLLMRMLVMISSSSTSLLRSSVWRMMLLSVTLLCLV